MAIEVRIPTILRTYTDGEKAVSGAGASLSALIDDLEANHPGLKERLVDVKNGKDDLRRFVNVYINDEDVRFIGGLEAELKDGDQVVVLPAVRRGLSMTGRRTFVLVDGENIDATLGNSLLGRRPTPDERPRWERVTDFAEQVLQQPVTGLFFLNASNGSLPASFVQALLAMNYRPIPLSGTADQKVVDVGIQRTLDALLAHDEADVLLVSHDADFVRQLAALVDGERRVGLIGLREYMSSQLTALGIPLYDLEDDVAAFNQPLPRVRIIPLDEFDPERFLR